MHTIKWMWAGRIECRSRILRRVLAGPLKSQHVSISEVTFDWHHYLTIGRKWVCGWPQAVEVVFALFVSPEFAAQVVVNLILRVLEVIFPVGGSLPNVKNSSGNGFLSIYVSNDSVHECNLALMRALDYGGAILAEGRIGTPEWAQYRRWGGFLAGLADVLMCDFVY